MSEGKILIVEDELAIRKLIGFNLQRSNFEVIETGEGQHALSLIKEHVPSLILLDLTLPDMDGLDLCAQLTENHPGIPIIIVSARGQDMEKIMGLELGADDYIVKPFNPLELVARIRSVLRRLSNPANQPDPDIIRTGPFVIELRTQKVYKSGNQIKLTHKEFQMIKVFTEKLNEPVTRDELLDEIWGLNYFGDPKTVDVHIRRLREKIEEDPSNPDYLKTIWGYGYSFFHDEVGK
ncbi:DNA-binding response regulator [Siminovitchia terrae]|uniref:DNA-binding response regulator n=1 Tax=Siminovitchia terrae TaxID=1914933 RepID=A0A429X590_SIMTE|nr:response regulator transcription factor [Siminovitchia terrae]RST58451.1 response regulator transcription factor [Siminovitchia terrae]GIN93988.1 DNA-binding response regulator [Siminovitchia terrae]GIN96739.1 DNA-binding response regulator [Siminovitchia terrae]